MCITRWMLKAAVIIIIIISCCYSWCQPSWKLAQWGGRNYWVVNRCLLLESALQFVPAGRYPDSNINPETLGWSLQHPWIQRMTCDPAQLQHWFENWHMTQWAPNGGNHKNFCRRETFFSTRRRLYVRSFLPPNGRRRGSKTEATEASGAKMWQGCSLKPLNAWIPWWVSHNHCSCYQHFYLQQVEFPVTSLQEF